MCGMCQLHNLGALGANSPSRTSRNDSKGYNERIKNATFLGGYHHDDGG
jgi:hypothetical protein